MKKSYLFLGLAILCEVFGTMMLKLSEGFSVLFPSIGVIASFIASFIYLGLSLKDIPLSTAYAIWAGLGTACTVAVGVVIFHEKLSLLKVLALFLVIAGVVILNKSMGNGRKTYQESNSHLRDTSG